MPETWKQDKKWKELTAAEKTLSCMEVLGCELTDIAVLLGTKTSRLRRIVDDGDQQYRPWEDAVLYRLCNGRITPMHVTGCIWSNRSASVTREADHILKAQLDASELAHRIAWRIDRLCKEDERFTTGYYVITVVSVYGHSLGSCRVTVTSPKYLPRAQVDIYIGNGIAMECASGDFSYPNKHKWREVNEVSMRQAAGTAKTFLASLLKSKVWQKKTA